MRQAQYQHTHIAYRTTTLCAAHERHGILLLRTIAGYHSMTRNSRRTLPNDNHSRLLRLSFPNSILESGSHDTFTPAWKRWYLAMLKYRGRAWRPTTPDRHSLPPEPYFCTIIPPRKIQKQNPWACRYGSAHAVSVFLVNAFAYYPQLHRSHFLFPRNSLVHQSTRASTSTHHSSSRIGENTAGLDNSINFSTSVLSAHSIMGLGDFSSLYR